MTKLMFNTSNVPFIDRDEFITPFDRLFDQIIDKHEKGEIVGDDSSYTVKWMKHLNL